MTQTAMPLLLDQLLDNFPLNRHTQLRPNQRRAFELIADNPGSLTLELPTGSGKTAVGYTFLSSLAKTNPEGSYYYIVPTKTLVDGVRLMHPEFQAVYGRREYDCLYYEPEEHYRADEIPCLSLRDCQHRVGQDTGMPMLPVIQPCPYYEARYAAGRGNLVVCTMAYYLYTQLFSRGRDLPAGLVIDEAHDIAKAFRSALSYDISDWHLHQAARLLRRIEANDEADQLEAFTRTMIRILRRKSPDTPSLLKSDELEELVEVLNRLDASAVERQLHQAIKGGKIDTTAERTVIKQLETVAFDLRRYVRSLEYALPGEGRKPLNYVTYAYSYKKPQGQERVQYRMVIRAYHVAPIVRKLMPERTLAYSATIGDPKIFGFETGIKAPFFSLPSNFPAERTLTCIPTDTPNLAKGKHIRAEPTKVLRRLAKSCHRLAEHGLRTLVVVTSNEDRLKFLRLSAEEDVEALTYDEAVSPREAMARFKNGEGTTLIGTAANYGQGVDMPGGLAPVTFCLKPSYPSPTDPATQFEQDKYGRGQAWAVWNWRAMIEALQVRGRNVRSDEDYGVTIFVSQQYRRFVHGTLPAWLQDSYRNDLTLEECCDQAIALLPAGVG